MPPVAWKSRGQFYAVAAQMMRRILVDRARARKMAKRSGKWARITVTDAARAMPTVNADILDLDAALARLAIFDARKCQLAELRFFGGLSLAEAGDALGISLATAERDWQGVAPRQTAAGAIVLVTAVRSRLLMMRRRPSSTIIGAKISDGRQPARSPSASAT